MPDGVTRPAPKDLRDERGGVLVMVAFWLPVLIMVFIFVADVGNWFEHRRHLQLQVDAAALAGGMAFGFPCSTTINTNIETAARNYGGSHTKYDDPAAPGSGSIHTTDFNNQVGGTAATDIHLLVNSQRFWRDDGNTVRQDYSDTSVDPSGRPCESQFLDVRATEDDLPWFIPFSWFNSLEDGVVPWIDARARVQIEKIAAIGGPALLPLFVRDVSPKSAAALFVNESAGMQLLDAEYLKKSSTCTTGSACWSNSVDVGGTPANVTIQDPGIGVFVALSSLPECQSPPPATPVQCFALPQTNGAYDTVQEICFQPGVECYWSDNTAARAGIMYIRSYGGDGAPPPGLPALRDVTLGPALSGTACPDGYFAFTEVDCGIHVAAEVQSGFVPENMRIRAYGGNCGNNGCNLTWTAASGLWEGTVQIPAVGNNPETFTPTMPIEIRWAYKSTFLDLDGDPSTPLVNCGNNFNNTPCAGTFGVGHRAFSATDYFSGPIREAALLDADDPIDTNPYSYPLGTAARLVVGVKLAGSIATDESDPPIRLRVATNQGAVDCDPAVPNFNEELAEGCGPQYEILDEEKYAARWQQADPCDPPYPTAQSLFQAAQPWTCVRVETGGKLGLFTPGMRGRMFNDRTRCQPGSCPARPQYGGVDVGCTIDANDVPGRNYWYASNGRESYLDARYVWDPRVVVLFMVPFGAFRNSGQELAPIVNFGAFYVTDWGGQGGGSNDDPCGTDGSVPAGWLSGHFINYTTPSNSGGGSGEQCDPSAFTPCVAVLVE